MGMDKNLEQTMVWQKAGFRAKSIFSVSIKGKNFEIPHNEELRAFIPTPPDSLKS